MTASQVAGEVAEHPYVKLATRVSMILVTLVVMPFTYWMVNTVYAIDKGYIGVLAIQADQQNQLASLISAQARMVQSVSELAISQARLDEKINTLKDTVDRNYRQIDALRDRVNRSNDVPKQ